MFSFLTYKQKKWLYKPLRKHSTVVIEGHVFLVRAFHRFACGILPALGTDAPRFAWPSFVRMPARWLALVQAHQDRAFSRRAQDIDLKARLKREGGVGQGGEGARLDPGRERGYIGRPLVLAT